MESPLWVLSGQTTVIRLTVPFESVRSVATTKESFRFSAKDVVSVSPPANDLNQSVHDQVIALIPEQLSGILILDETNRYQIEVPKSW